MMEFVGGMLKQLGFDSELVTADGTGEHVVRRRRRYELILAKVSVACVFVVLKTARQGPDTCGWERFHVE